MKKRSITIKPKVVTNVILVVLALLLIILLVMKGCVKKGYTVRFDSDGGSIVSSVVVKGKESIDKPKAPTKDGYIFDGWYEGNNIFDFDTKISKDTVLVAHWRLDQIQLKNEEISLEVGGVEDVVISYLPDGLSVNDLVYASSDADVVSIDKTGKIRALKDGTATIIINSKDGKYTAVSKVTVTMKGQAIVDVEGLTITGDDTVVEGKSIKLTAVIDPNNATNKTITWKSSDSKVATVDSNGNVNAIGVGTATITATTANGKSATKIVKVIEEVLPTRVSISGANEVKAGESIKLTVTFEPNNTTNKQITWKSSNSAVAKVDTTGKVTGVSAGTVTITATTTNGKKATKEIKVTNVDAKKIAISGTKEVYVGSSITLKATITPSNTTNKKVTWSVDNSNIATIDQKGKLTGKKAGKVTVTAKTVNGLSATYTVTVKEKAASYVITLTAVHLEATDGVAQYKVSITKNGVVLDQNAFTGFVYNKSEYLSTTTTIQKKYIDTSVKTATIKLKDGTSVSATVKHVN